MSEEDIATLERLAESKQSSADPMLLGWYYLRRADATRAEHWFRISYDRQQTAESAQGLSLALIMRKRPAEAEAALARWRDANEDAGKAYAGKAYMAAAISLLAQQPPPVIASDVLKRIVETTAKRRDPVATQQIGWLSRSYGQDETAGQWFATALARKPDDEPSAYGLAVVDSALKRSDALRTLLRVWGARSPRMLALVDHAQQCVRKSLRSKASRRLRLGNRGTRTWRRTRRPRHLREGALPRKQNLKSRKTRAAASQIVGPALLPRNAGRLLACRKRGASCSSVDRRRRLWRSAPY